MKKLFSILTLLSATLISQAQQKITFNALDGIPITADVYWVDDKAPLILMCHQAGYSRGEYNEIAPALNKLGYNCIAMDQRSGNEVNGVKNETAQNAMTKGIESTYLDAEKDIIAAIKYINFRYHPTVFYLWGSSYSASLVLHLGFVNTNIGAIIAFSPGEYFNGAMNVKETISKLYKPVFVTSTKSEAADVKELVKGIELAHQFVPTAEGAHGSKALWQSTPDHDEYWTALKAFLDWAKTWKPQK